MGVSGWAEAGGWVGACSCSRVAQGPPGGLALLLQALSWLLAPSWWRQSSPGSISQAAPPASTAPMRTSGRGGLSGSACCPARPIFRPLWATCCVEPAPQPRALEGLAFSDHRAHGGWHGHPVHTLGLAILGKTSFPAAKVLSARLSARRPSRTPAGRSRAASPGAGVGALALPHS